MMLAFFAVAQRFVRVLCGAKYNSLVIIMSMLLRNISTAIDTHVFCCSACVNMALHAVRTCSKEQLFSTATASV